MKHDGGPAFPNMHRNIYGGEITGMSLRDYFAAMALRAIIDKQGYGTPDHDIAKKAFEIADAMLREREK